MVRLNKQEMALTKQAGAARWQLARASGIKDQVVDKGRDPMAIDRLGVRAEVAVAKVLNLDFSAAALGVDSGGDLHIPTKGDQFLTAQIKSTFHKNGNLLFKLNEKFNFDCAILVCAQTHEPDCNEFEIAGCIGIRQINIKKHKTDKGMGQGWQVNREHLTPIRDLWQHIQQRRLA